MESSTHPVKALQPESLSQYLTAEMHGLDLNLPYYRSLQVFFKQVSGHKYMFLDEDKNICKMSNGNEISFYKTNCPDILRDFVPQYKSEFYLVPGRDRIDLDEEFDIARYCPTTSISSASLNSSQSSLDSELSEKELHNLLLIDEQL